MSADEFISHSNTDTYARKEERGIAGLHFGLYLRPVHEICVKLYLRKHMLK